MQSFSLLFYFLSIIDSADKARKNHDLDFGVPQFRHLSKQCYFPWLLANVLDPALGEDVPLGGCQKTLVIESSNGIKIGVIGLAEREWLETINALPPNLIYKSASETAKRLVPSLRAEGAEIIIALTHQREPNDLKLAKNTPPGLIDVILGGHDHFYNHECINETTHILRSGTDFKQLSYVEARRKPDGQVGWNLNIIRRDITRKLPEDPEAMKVVDKMTSSLKEKLEKPVGYSAVSLDGRFTTVRTRESNLGNFVSDLMRYFHSADCAIIASGTIRGDQVYPPGVIRIKDVLNCFPFEDPVVVLRVSGKAILTALENSVSLLPAFEGRFPQVSNIQFEYDQSLAPFSRVLWVKVNRAPLDLAQQYTVSTRGYMARGKDGFTSLLAKSEGGTAEEVVSEENGILLSMMLRQYFMSLKVLGKWARWSPSLHRHWGGIHQELHVDDKVKKPGPAKSGMKHGRNGSVKTSGDVSKIEVRGVSVDSDTEDEKEADLDQDRESEESRQHRRMHIARVFTRRWMDLAGIDRQQASPIEPHDHGSEWILPLWTHGIAPRVEGRIIAKGQALQDPETGA